MSNIPTTSGIYQITCTANGKIYIGSAANLIARWRVHQSELNNSKHGNTHLQRAWDKYGASTFTFTVIELVDKECLLEREQYWLDSTQAYQRAIGFNICSVAGSALGVTHTPETRERNSQAQKRRYQDPTARAAQATRTRAFYADPDNRARHAEWLRNLSRTMYSDPEIREQIIAKRKVALARPETKTRMRLATKARFSDPVERERQAERTRAYFAESDARDKLKATLKQVWADSSRRQQQRERVKALWQDPDYQAKMAKVHQEGRSEETRAKIGEASKLMWERQEVIDAARDRFNAMMTPEKRAEVNKAKQVLTMDQAREIRTLYATGAWSMEKLAKHYGVSVGTIHGIVRGIRYQDD